jgi:hypothetical protein
MLAKRSPVEMRCFIDIIMRDRVHDVEGQDFIDLAEARDEAVEAFREILANELRNGRLLCLGWVAQVRDESGATIFEIPVSELMCEGPDVLSPSNWQEEIALGQRAPTG